MSDILETLKATFYEGRGLMKRQWSVQEAKEIIAEVERLRSDLIICDEVDAETQQMIEAADKLIVKNGDMEQEITNLKSQLEAVTRERDIDKLIEDRKRLRIENNDLRAGKERLEAENSELKAEIRKINE